MADKKVLKKNRDLEFHIMLKSEAIEAMETLLQDKNVSIEKTLEDMEDLETLIQGHIEGLRDDIKAERN